MKMKKLVTLSLAALMVLSLSVTAFAAPSPGPATDAQVTPISVSPATDEDGFGSIVGDFACVSLRDFWDDEDDILAPYNSALHPGMTIYFLLSNRDDNGPLKASDAAKNIKVKVKDLTGGELVESYRIEYKKLFINEYGYVLAIKTKERADTGIKHVGAEVTLSKSSPAEYKFEAVYNIGFSINYHRLTTEVFRFPVVLDYNYSATSPDSEVTIDFPEAGDVHFEVDMFQQGRIIAAFNNRFNSEIAAEYPEANLDFYNGNGAVFAKIGVLTIPAAEGSVLYVQDAEGNLTKVDAEYDSGEEAFKVNTRVLGKYVVADRELDLTLAPEVPTEPVVEQPKPNVNTGAAA
jgi:hypothetical protein